MTRHAMKPKPEPAASDADDKALLARVVLKDRSAIGDLYVRYQPRLIKFAFRITRSYEVAEELVNDIMLTVWTKAASFRGDSKVSTWIFGIAYRKSLGQITKKSLNVMSDYRFDQLEAEDSRDLEKENWIDEGLRQLPAAHRLTTVLVFYLGLSYEEVAKATGCPVNTVKTRMYHARRKLKSSLEELALPTNEIGNSYDR